MSPTVIGLDLSLTGTGISIGGECATIKTSSKDGVIEERLDMIVHSVSAHMKRVGGAPTLAIIEDYALHGPGDKGKIGMVHGAVRLHLHREDIPMIFVPPTSLKKFTTGRGNAGKPDMMLAVLKRYGFESSDDNQVDAFALYALGRHVIDSPLADLPAVNLEALTKLDLSAARDF